MNSDERKAFLYWEAFDVGTEKCKIEWVQDRWEEHCERMPHIMAEKQESSG